MITVQSVAAKWRTDKHTWLLLAIVVIGTALRFYRIDWALPYRFHVDEHQYVVTETLKYWERIVYEGDFNPHLSTYGTLPLYSLIVARLVVLVPQALISGTPITPEYLTADHAWLTYTAGRAISAAFSAATIYLFYVIGRRLYNKSAGLLAAALAASSVSLIQAAHYYTVDSMLIFFLTLGFIQAINVLQRGDRRSYVRAGLCLALAMAVKLPALFLLPVFVAAHLFNAHAPVWQGRWRDRGLIRRFFDRRLIALGFSALLLYAALSPFTFLDFAALYLSGANLNAARNVKLAFLEPFQTWTLAYYGLTPYLYELTTLLPYGLGLATVVASLLGTIVMARRFDKSDRLLLVWVIPFFLVIGFNRVKTVRYILPLLPFFAACGAVGLDALRQWAASRRINWTSTVATALVLATGLAYAVAFTGLYGERDSRLQASDWLYQHAAAGSIVVVEDEFTYTAPLGVPDDEVDYWNRRVVEPEAAPPRIFDVRVLFSPYYTAYETSDAASKTAHICDTLDGADYVVVSERHYHPYSRLPNYRPIEYRYYENLFNGSLGYRLAAEFDPSPNLFGVTLNDDGAELYMKVFDHPKLWVFQRGEAGALDCLSALSGEHAQ